ncbi:hypothetical protein LK533_10880 [Sphingomonas sp. PL-96]|uniref:hypothetical protein n=1 Tax=Sphingomonas sp. PL-96 TaxID=2887201 RepID=UPI001E63A4E9|nr:hypothetical protein [Sphingomonas sp. PL-96]MCC2977174.1 hypothetical protein [Sphingomonas sp. PL-96]
MYFEYLTIRISPNMRAELLAHVAQIDSDPSKFVRELIARALSTARDAKGEMQRQVLFCAVALDYLLEVQEAPSLRQKAIDDWKKIVAEWERPSGD